MARELAVVSLAGAAPAPSAPNSSEPVSACSVEAAESADASRSASVELEDEMEALTMADTAEPTKEITLRVASEVEAPPLLLPLTELITEATEPAIVRTPMASTELDAEEAVEDSGTAGMDSGTPITYVPAPPVPEPSAVTTVPGSTPAPVTGMPTVTLPDAMEDTVRVFPEMEATIVGGEGGVAADNVVAATIWGTLTVYVPAPPLPVPTAVTTVPVATPGPTTGEPTERVPDVTELTVRVVPEMAPVKEAAGDVPTMLVLVTV